MLLNRQRHLLSLLDALGGRVCGMDFQKLLFLYCHEEEPAPYEFVPYKFGAFSFTSYADRRKLVERMSSGPAAMLGLKTKGTLAPGADADLVIVDPDATWTPAAPYFSKSRNTPFTGRKLKGRALTTLSAGRVVHAL